jgi:tRNA G46 methylase TrmB
LKKGGTIRIATDHSGYFEQIQKVLDEKNDVLQEIDFLPTAGVGIGEWVDSTHSTGSGQAGSPQADSAGSPQVGTNFERKYLKEQRPIYTIAVKKTAADSI